MEKQDVSGFIFADKPVFDWNKVPIGTIADLRRDPKTHAARQLVVTLTPQAKTQMGTKEDLVEIPVSYVFGIRKDAVSLDRSVEELRNMDRVAHLIR